MSSCRCPCALASHHSCDVTVGEDVPRVCFNPGVIGRLHRFADTILEAIQTSTLAQDRHRVALGSINLKFKPEHYRPA